LARFGWESNHHSYMVDERLKKDDELSERRSTPSTAPQIIVRGPRSDSDARSVSPSSRCRSSSLAVTTSPSVARRVDPRLRRTRSATAVHLANHHRRTSTKGSDDATPRHERAVTGDSIFTSGLGSLSEDSATADGS
uniref:DUF4005 domain-containing protein n=1 Tax=Haemonchus placei TaxID=6290 RepID=A0A0N4VZX8_HAEPC